jgi:hypothetical protein
MYLGSREYGGLIYHHYYYSFLDDFQIPYAGYYYNDGEYENYSSALWYSTPIYADEAEGFRFIYDESY